MNDHVLTPPAGIPAMSDSSSRFWTAAEDATLVQLIGEHGSKKWSLVAHAGADILAGRTGKQCRERWHNHLSPDRSTQNNRFSEAEDYKLLISLHRIGFDWFELAKYLPGRTANNIKNHWTTCNSFCRCFLDTKYGVGVYPLQPGTDFGPSAGGRFGSAFSTAGDELFPLVDTLDLVAAMGREKKRPMTYSEGVTETDAAFFKARRCLLIRQLRECGGCHIDALLGKIVLVRHGESTANAGGVAAADPGTIPLTERGRGMAVAFAERFDGDADVIISSSFTRADDTAAPLRTRCPDAVCEMWPIHEFTYLDKTACVGTTFVGRREMVASFWEKAAVDATHCEGGNAESYTSFHQRVEDCCSRLVGLFLAGPGKEQSAASPQTVVVFGHELFFQALIHIFINGPLSCDKFRDWSSTMRIPNTGSVTLLVQRPVSSSEASASLSSSASSSAVSVFVGPVTSNDD